MFPIIKYLKFLIHFITFWPMLFSRHKFYVCTKNHCCMSWSPSYWHKGRPVQSIIVNHKKSEVVTQKHILYPDGTGNCIRKTKVLCLIILTSSYQNIFFSRYWYIGADNGTSTVDIVETWRQNILEPHKPTTKPCKSKQKFYGGHWNNPSHITTCEQAIKFFKCKI